MAACGIGDAFIQAKSNQGSATHPATVDGVGFYQPEGQRHFRGDEQQPTQPEDVEQAALRQQAEQCEVRRHEHAQRREGYAGRGQLEASLKQRAVCDIGERDAEYGEEGSPAAEPKAERSSEQERGIWAVHSEPAERCRQRRALRGQKLSDDYHRDRESQAGGGMKGGIAQ